MDDSGTRNARVEADQHRLMDRLHSLALPPGDYAVFGSGPLIVRGIIEATNDLDVISRGAAWDRARHLGDVAYLEEHDVEVVSFDDGAITVGTSWAYGEFDIDRLIDPAETIDGLPFVRLEHVVRYKEAAARPKDLAHLAALANYQDASDHAGEQPSAVVRYVAMISDTAR